MREIKEGRRNKGLRLEAQLTDGTREAKTPKTKETAKGFKRPD